MRPIDVTLLHLSHPGIRSQCVDSKNSTFVFFGSPSTAVAASLLIQQHCSLSEHGPGPQHWHARQVPGLQQGASWLHWGPPTPANCQQQHVLCMQEQGDAFTAALLGCSAVACSCSVGACSWLAVMTAVQSWAMPHECDFVDVVATSTCWPMQYLQADLAVPAAGACSGALSASGPYQAASHGQAAACGSQSGSSSQAAGHALSAPGGRPLGC